MKRTAPSSPTEYSPPSKISAPNETNAQFSIWELPEEVLGIIGGYITPGELLEVRITAQRFCNIAERCFKDLFSSVWKSDINFYPFNGSWCAQFFKWEADYSQLKHSLPKVTWCVEHGADRKLRSLLHVPPPHRKRMLRLLNAPTTLRMEDSPLHYACAIGCIDVLQVILSYPNGLESVNKLIQGECRGVSALWTPLHYAISCGHADVVKLVSKLISYLFLITELFSDSALLLEHGANAHLEEKGVVNILLFAKLCGKEPEIVNILSSV